VVGVNKYQINEDADARAALKRPNSESITAQLERLEQYRKNRDNDAVIRALDYLAETANSTDVNVFGAAVDAIIAGATHGEVVTTLRREMGNGEPLIVL